MTKKQVQPISKSHILFSKYYIIVYIFKHNNILLQTQQYGIESRPRSIKMSEVVVKLIGNYSYQTSRCLGEGVYGKVYEGIERQSKQKVAIKKIDLNIFTNDKYLENAIFSEIYLLKRFNHPNIVRFKDVLSSKNSLYIITEFCKNGDLKQLIKRKRFKEEEAFEIMRQLLSGFSELVRQKIIHRDLKPANILISEGIYKIGDFGFAKYVDNFGSQMLKSCVGSPIYMAPQILERTPYTTKCDIWSLGIIFFQMIHGYPPWKARDENQLLRSIKNIPVTQLLKKSHLSQKGNQFLKRTLAFSEEERIGWNELFELFGAKQEKHEEEVQNSPHKQKARVHSVHSNPNIMVNNLTGNQPQDQQNWRQSTSNPSPPSNYPSIPQSISSTPVINIQNQYNPSLNVDTNNHPNLTAQRQKSANYYSNRDNSNLSLKTNHSSSNEGAMYNNNTTTTSINQSSTSSSKRAAQIDSTLQWRQHLVYYHFYCLELMNNFKNIQTIIPKFDIFCKLLFGLSMMIKNRSTFCLSMIVMHAKVNKNIEDLYKKMQNQHEFYEMNFNDVVALLEKYGQYKNIRSDYSVNVGHNDVISDDRMEKMENFMITAATQNAQILSEQVKKRVKIITNRDYYLVEVLDNVLDVLRLALGKSKSIREIQEEDKEQDEDIKDFVARVFGKVDRLSANM